MNGRKTAIDRVRHRLKDLQKKVRAQFTDKEWIKSETESILDEYMLSGGIRPTIEIRKELEQIGSLFVKTHENIERSDIRTRTREEWVEIERQFIPPEPVEIPEGYRVCACWNCNNLFKRKGKTMYCSPKCTQEQMNANGRLRDTGTYLAPKKDGYKPNREENAGKKDDARLIFSEDIDKYDWRTKADGNRQHSPRRSPDKPTKKEKLRMGEKLSQSIERQKKYDAFIRGESHGLFTINIKSGLKIYHENGKKHEYSEKDSSIGA